MVAERQTFVNMSTTTPDIIPGHLIDTPSDNETSIPTPVCTLSISYNYNWINTTAKLNIPQAMADIPKKTASSRTNPSHSTIVYPTN